MVHPAAFDENTTLNKSTNTKKKKTDYRVIRLHEQQELPPGKLSFLAFEKNSHSSSRRRHATRTSQKLSRYGTISEHEESEHSERLMFC